MSLAYLFPGQGSQYLGMGAKWLEKYPYIKDYFDIADTIVPVSKLCFQGPEEDLLKTSYTQPCILTVSVAMFEVLKRETNLKPSYVAGHSLGEYSALVASGGLDFKEAVSLVHTRGKLMQEAVPLGLGKMLALRKCPSKVLDEEIQKVRANFNDINCISVANYNSEDQIVVSGKKEAVDFLASNLSSLKIKSIPLNVSAPFHSALMSSIVPAFKEALNKVKLNKLNIPYLANVDSKVYSYNNYILDNLAKQIPGSVLWTQTMYNLKNLNVDKAIEVGPGKVLSRLVNSFECISMDELNSLEGL